MKFVKLKEYCKDKSISYTSGYRWFKDGQIPGAYQTDSGTILVPSEDTEELSKGDNAMSMFLKKTIEFSKNEGSVEDFAAWVISTFSLKLNSSDVPKYSRVKPNPEDMQKHFQSFIPKSEKPKPYNADPETINQMLAEAEKIENERVPTTGGTTVSQNVSENTTELGVLAGVAGQTTDNSFDISSGLCSFTAPSAGIAPTTICSVSPYDPSAQVSLNYYVQPTNGTIIATNCSSLGAGTSLVAPTNSIFPQDIGTYFNQVELAVAEPEKTITSERSKRGRKPASYYKDKENK
jgi:hypothetical protein